MLWTSDVVKDPWFPLVKDPSDAWVIGLARYVGDWASDATWVKDLHSSLVPLVKDARYVGCETILWTSTSTWVSRPCSGLATW